MGEDYVLKKHWSGAVKAFGESAHAFPAPKTLLALVSAELKMLAQITSRKKGPNNQERGDLEHAIAMYKTTLAADKVLNSLASNERKHLRYNIECIKKYLDTGTVEESCVPLKTYGVVK